MSQSQPKHFSVSVSKDYLTFSAAHFLGIPGHKCESLHGHNYLATIVIEGEIDGASGFVVDFAVVKEILRPVLETLDHRVMVPTNNRNLKVSTAGDLTQVEYLGKPRFVFPRSNVALVAVAETTAELLAGFLAEEVAKELIRRQIVGLRAITVDLEESPGQSGRCHVSISPGGIDVTSHGAAVD